MPDSGNTLFEENGYLTRAEDQGERLDLAVSRLAGITRAKAKNRILDGLCRVDGAVVTTPAAKLKAGQRIRLDQAEQGTELTPEYEVLDVLYRDEHIAVINKPPNLTVHPCPSCPEGTMVQRLLALFPELARQEGLRPGIVHRLDKDTSGLIVVALTEEARLKLSDDFASHNVDKTYLALCRGAPSASGSSQLPLGRDPTSRIKMAVVPENKGGRHASTEWTNLFTGPAKDFSLLSVHILTGRTHQIRVHMAQAGFPLYGDKLYGPSDKSGLVPRQMLHAWKLRLAHPHTGKPLSFICPPPQDFMETLQKLAERSLGLLPVILTGNPGSGKSSVLQQLSIHGIPVWSADECVNRLYAPGGDAWTMLKGRFGSRFVHAPNQPDKREKKPSFEEVVDRRALTEAMAEDVNLRREVESMIHPIVFADMQTFFDAAATNGAAFAVAEVPLWLESGGDGGLAPKGPGKPVVVTVVSPQNTRCLRLMENRGWSPEKCAAVESWQWPEQAKAEASDIRLPNQGSKADLARNVAVLVDELHSVKQRRKQALLRRIQALLSTECA